MISDLRKSFQAQPQDVRMKVVRIYAGLLVFNIFAWSWAALVFHGNSVLWGAAFLAYSFGLRHAVDADHIAAIDNVTRTLMQKGGQPVTIGLMFSLGHSTVVVAGSIVISFAASTLQHLTVIREIGGIFGTLMSTIFLFGIGIANISVLYSTWKSFRRVRCGDLILTEGSDSLSNNSGFLNRLFRPVLRLIRRDWQMYPLGILFGLGFDTASEIGLLGIAATETSRNLPVWSILIFPMLFAASMSPIDTTDNILMLAPMAGPSSSPFASFTTTSRSP